MPCCRVCGVEADVEKCSGQPGPISSPYTAQRGEVANDPASVGSTSCAARQPGDVGVVSFEVVPGRRRRETAVGSEARERTSPARCPRGWASAVVNGRSAIRDGRRRDRSPASTIVINDGHSDLRQPICSRWWIIKLWSRRPRGTLQVLGGSSRAFGRPTLRPNKCPKPGGGQATLLDSSASKQSSTCSIVGRAGTSCGVESASFFIARARRMCRLIVEVEQSRRSAS